MPETSELIVTRQDSPILTMKDGSIRSQKRFTALVISGRFFKNVHNGPLVLEVFVIERQCLAEFALFNYPKEIKSGDWVKINILPITEYLKGQIPFADLTYFEPLYETRLDSDGFLEVG
jgi:hypothetical protein